jgi:hypothetical protein
MKPIIRIAKEILSRKDIVLSTPRAGKPLHSLKLKDGGDILDYVRIDLNKEGYGRHKQFILCLKHLIKLIKGKRTQGGMKK